jgi:RNA polymerase sigma-70 factor, ECF subfamily
MSGDEKDSSPVALLSDDLLLEGVARGDAASFETLFYRHYDRVYGLLFRLLGNRVEAEDVTQEVFLKLHRQRFAAGREHNVSAWLYQVATNLGYNAIRSRKRLWQRNVHMVPEPMDTRNDPAIKVEQRQNRAETLARVRAALASLPERQSQLLLLRQMGLSYAELAEACQVAPGSVGTLLARAAKAFRDVYREEREADDADDADFDSYQRHQR